MKNALPGRTEQDRPRWVTRLPGVTSLLVLLIGTTVLAGWVLGMDLLRHLHPSMPAMVPLTALCLVLSAGAVWLLRGEGPGRRLGRLMAGGVAAAGVLMLASYAWGQALPLSREALALRMSPHTSLGFALLGTSLLYLDRQPPWGNVRSQWLALLASLPSLTALAGYAYHERRFYSIEAGIGMALHTAWAQLLLAAGILGLRPDHGPMAAIAVSTAGGMMARRMLPTLLLPLGVGAAVTQGTRLGLFDSSLSLPLFGVVMMVALAVTIWRSAISLNHLHAEQKKAEQHARTEAECQRTLAAENARLYQAAQKAVRGREDVLAIVSHDLKNPLSAIRLSTAVLTARLAAVPDSASLARSVGAIERAAVHMQRLISQLQDAARLDSGQPLAIERKPEPLPPLVTEALALIEPQSTQKALRLERHLATTASVLCDRERVLQVLDNLLSNAVKFTPEGGTIAVKAQQLDGEVRVEVRDTGPGIPEAQRTHLFERYWQAESTARQGSGLGLYIAKGIIDAHGGHLWVESTVGEGSTFTFTLPLAPPGGGTGEA